MKKILLSLTAITILAVCGGEQKPSTEEAIIIKTDATAKKRSC